MKVVYAVQFEIYPDEKMKWFDIIADLKRYISEWIEQWYDDKKGMKYKLIWKKGKLEPMQKHSIEISEQATPSGDCLCGITWSYPSDTDSNLIWQSYCLITHSENTFEFSFILRVSSEKFEIKPTAFEVFRPRIVKTIVEKFSCFLGGQQITANAIELDTSNITQFIKEVLLSTQRSLPIILISRVNETNTSIVDPLRFADRFIGLARVYTLKDKWASFSLSDEIGREYSCFNGAIRIYWPAFSTRDNPFKHPLYTIPKLTYMAADGKNLSDVIFWKLTSISAFRIIEGDVTKTVLERLKLEANKNKIMIEKQMENGKLSTDNLKSELMKAYKIIETKESTIQDKDGIIKYLQDENEKQKRYWWEHLKQLKEEPKLEDTSTQITEQTTKTVTDALEKASCDFQSSIVVLDSAKQSANESRFPRPEQVYNALMAIAEVSKKYFETRGKESMGPWEQIFTGFGFTYAPHDAETTKTMYRSQRTFKHGDEKIFMEKHIRIGGASRENCIQIYFEISEKDNKFLIGYCGPHLDYSGMRT